MRRTLTGNIGKTASASMVQFALTLLTTPVMTRLFQPEAYATFGVLNGWAAVLVGVGLLSLPNAYCAQKQSEDRQAILQTMVLLLSGVVALSALAVVVLFLQGMFFGQGAISGGGLLVLPLLVLTYGMRQIVVTMAIQSAQFGRLSLGQMIEPLCSRVGSVALGVALGGNPLWILVAVMTGQLSMIATLRGAISFSIFNRQWWSAGVFTTLISTLRRFLDFVWFSTVSQQAQPVMMLGLQMGAAFFFGGHLAGQYILAVSILTLPVSLIALATAPVIYHHFIDTEKHTPELLKHYVLRMLALYVAAGLVIYGPVLVWGQYLFATAFGKVWAEAGVIAGSLSVAFIGSFALTAVQSVMMVTRRLKLQCVAELMTATLLLLLAMVIFKTMAFEKAIFYLSILWLMRNVVLLLVSLRAARRHPLASE